MEDYRRFPDFLIRFMKLDYVDPGWGERFTRKVGWHVRHE